MTILILFIITVLRLIKNNVLMKGFHGSEGPFLVSDVRTTPLVDSFLNAGKEMGYLTKDVNGEDQLGKSYYF